MIYVKKKKKSHWFVCFSNSRLLKKFTTKNKVEIEKVLATSTGFRTNLFKTQIGKIVSFPGSDLFLENLSIIKMGTWWFFLTIQKFFGRFREKKKSTTGIRLGSKQVSSKSAKEMEKSKKKQTVPSILLLQNLSYSPTYLSILPLLYWSPYPCFFLLILSIPRPSNLSNILTESPPFQLKTCSPSLECPPYDLITLNP